MKRKQIRLQVNRAAAGEQLQVNITTQVNAQQIRREQVNGRDTWIVPSYTLPANVVMNGGLYTAAEIDAHYQELEGTVAPLGHPTVNGKNVSAFSPEGLAGFYIGATNQNVRKIGNRVYLEKVIDVETAQLHEGGRRLLARLEALEKGEDVPPVHTSVAAFVERMEANQEQRAQGAQWVPHIHRMDHDAILLDINGAATPEQGVGMMVNADQAQPLQANAGALVGESYREREARLSQAASKRWGSEPDNYVWVADFTDSQAVIVRNGGQSEVFAYTDTGGVITFADAGAPVVRQESWTAVIANSFKRFFTQQARPVITKEAQMPITAEERAELVKDFGAAVTPIVNAAVADAIKPIAEKVDGLETNVKATADAVTANARAEEATQRAAVEAKFGKDVAAGLTGNALVALYKQCGEAAALGTGDLQGNADTGAPDPATYFGAAK